MNGTEYNAIEKIIRNVTMLMRIRMIETPTKLAEMMDAAGLPYSQPNLSRLLNGKYLTIELESVIKLARFFHVTVGQLCGEEKLDLNWCMAMPYTEEKMYSFTSVLPANEPYQLKTEITCSHWWSSAQSDLYSVISIHYGNASIQVDITSEQARSIAKQMHAFADDLDGHHNFVNRAPLEAA